MQIIHHRNKRDLIAIQINPAPFPATRALSPAPTNSFYPLARMILVLLDE
ncbi:hypothetical protein [Burkholderia pseudomultivorans]|nr:hypothetical protein [Burkholderia pseudomultivorans]